MALTYLSTTHGNESSSPAQYRPGVGPTMIFAIAMFVKINKLIAPLEIILQASCLKIGKHT